MNLFTRSLVLLVAFSICLLEAQIVELTDKVSPSVVSLSVETNNANYSGTGFFVDSNGIVATNYHVVDGARKITAKTKGGVNLFCKGVLSLDKDKDLALLKFAAKNQPALKLGEYGKIKQGESIVVIGSPKGLEQTVSNGIVSAMREENSWHTVQITAPISPGSSGSPVVNMNGEVLGVATYNVVDSQNLNFASSVRHLAVMVKAIDNLEMISLIEAFPESKRDAVSKSGSTTQTTIKDKENDRKIELFEKFWKDFQDSLDENNSESYLKHFSNIVDYQYIKGDATKTQIKRGLLEFYAKYPNRKYSIKGEPTVKILDGGAKNKIGLDFTFTYNYQGQKQASGKAFVELALQYTSKGWKIYKFRERVESEGASSSDSSLSPKEVRIQGFKKLAQTFLIGGNSSKIINQSSMLADNVDYFGKKFTREQAIVDILAYRKKWPIRSYQPEASTVTLDGDNQAVIKTWFTFRCESATEISEGKFRSLMRATYINGKYEITSISSDKKERHAIKNK